MQRSKYCGIASIQKTSCPKHKSGKENYLHFELRKGTKSLDPEPLFN